MYDFITGSTWPSQGDRISPGLSHRMLPGPGHPEPLDLQGGVAFWYNVLAQHSERAARESSRSQPERFSTRMLTFHHRSYWRQEDALQALTFVAGHVIDPKGGPSKSVSEKRKTAPLSCRGTGRRALIGVGVASTHLHTESAQVIACVNC